MRVSIPPLHKLELFTGLNAFSIQQFTVVNFRRVIDLNPCIASTVMLWEVLT